MQRQKQNGSSEGGCSSFSRNR